jgi:AraC-like DNA-binding protein
MVVQAAGHGGRHFASRPDGVSFASVMVCVSGEGWVRIDGAVHPVRPGTAMVVAAGAPHEFGAGAVPWTSWWCTMRGQDVDELFEALGASPGNPVVPVHKLEEAVALIDEILTGYENDQSPANILRATGAAWRLLTQLAADQGHATARGPLGGAMEYVARHLADSLAVSQVAAAVGLSSSHLSSLFRTATGKGVLAYQIGLRMARARRLLDTTHNRVGEVAHAVGYRDPLYFSRQFTRIHGMSPSDYRRRLQP